MLPSLNLYLLKAIKQRNGVVKLTACLVIHLRQIYFIKGKNHLEHQTNLIKANYL